MDRKLWIAGETVPQSFIDNLSPCNYCIEEVERQGHDTSRLEGIERVGWMLNAWAFALENSHRLPGVSDAITLGITVEPGKNQNGIRRVGVRVGNRVCPHPETVDGSLVTLFQYGMDSDPIAFYKAFEEIHPFVDGNGRTGKILLNWLNGSLLQPIFPPADLWGRPIRNP